MCYAGLGIAGILTGFIGMDKVVRPERLAAADFMCFHVLALLLFFIGTRHLFPLPTELKANWISQITAERRSRRVVKSDGRLVDYWRGRELRCIKATGTKQNVFFHRLVVLASRIRAHPLRPFGS
jgi:hypothetical protein